MVLIRSSLLSQEITGSSICATEGLFFNPNPVTHSLALEQQHRNLTFTFHAPVLTRKISRFLKTRRVLKVFNTHTKLSCWSHYGGTAPKRKKIRARVVDFAVKLEPSTHYAILDTGWKNSGLSISAFNFKMMMKTKSGNLKKIGFYEVR